MARGCFVTLCVLIVLICPCSLGTRGPETQQSVVPPELLPVGEQAANLALGRLGQVAFQTGPRDAEGSFDTSGFVHSCFRDFVPGYKEAVHAADFPGSLPFVNVDAPLKGDVLTFGTSGMGIVVSVDASGQSGEFAYASFRNQMVERAVFPAEWMKPATIQFYRYTPSTTTEVASPLTVSPMESDGIDTNPDPEVPSADVSPPEVEDTDESTPPDETAAEMVDGPESVEASESDEEEAVGEGEEEDPHTQEVEEQEVTEDVPQVEEKPQDVPQESQVEEKPQDVPQEEVPQDVPQESQVEEKPQDVPQESQVEEKPQDVPQEEQEKAVEPSMNKDTSDEDAPPQETEETEPQAVEPSMNKDTSDEDAPPQEQETLCEEKPQDVPQDVPQDEENEEQEKAVEPLMNRDTSDEDTPPQETLCEEKPKEVNPCPLPQEPQEQTQEQVVTTQDGRKIPIADIQDYQPGYTVMGDEDGYYAVPPEEAEGIDGSPAPAEETVQCDPGTGKPVLPQEVRDGEVPATQGEKHDQSKMVEAARTVSELADKLEAAQALHCAAEKKLHDALGTSV